MTLTIQSSLPFSVDACLKEEGVKKQTTFQRVKNVLTGRVFENWREQLLSVATVYYVIKAALSFFSLHFFVFFIELSTAAFMAVLRKEIADFTDLHKATGNIREQNMEFALNNLDLRENVREFKAQMTELKKESANFQRNNENYEYNNQIHAELIRGLESTTSELGEEIRNSLSSGTALTEDVLKKYLGKLQKFEDTKETLRAIQTEMSEERTEALERFEKLTVQVNEMSINGVKALREAEEQLQKTLKEISTAEERARSLGEQIQRLETQIDRLETQINHLENTRKDLQKDERNIRTTIGKLNTAADRNVASANMAAGIIKSLFYSTDSSGESRFTLDRVFVGTMLVAFVTQAYFKS